MDIKKKCGDFCDGCLVWFIIGSIVLFLIAGIYSVVVLITHRNDKEHDELYDEYLEEKYDGMERYDPF
jgi:hypothetical protein